MSVDKFGRQTSSRGSNPQKGPKGDGFHLTPDGDYNVQQKRLRFVKDAIDDEDAVNLKTLGKTCISVVNGVFDARGKSITNVLNNDKTYNEVDVVNKKYVNEHFVRYNYNSRLGTIDAKRNVIVNLHDPIGPQHAATRKYVDSRVPAQDSVNWDFFHKRIANVENPVDHKDAVNKRYFENNSPRINGENGTWDFFKYRLSSVAKPLKMDDAVNREYYEEGLAKLSYAVYKLTRGTTHTSLITPEEWKAKVMLSTPWDDLFK